MNYLLLKSIESDYLKKTYRFKNGDLVCVNVLIKKQIKKEFKHIKERLFANLPGLNSTITVRRIAKGIG
jgi:ribosomal protein L19